MLYFKFSLKLDGKFFQQPKVDIMSLVEVLIKFNKTCNNQITIRTSVTLKKELIGVSLSNNEITENWWLLTNHRPGILEMTTRSTQPECSCERTQCDQESVSHHHVVEDGFETCNLSTSRCCRTTSPWINSRWKI